LAFVFSILQARFKTLQFIEEIHRSVDNRGIQVYTKSSILALFGEFFIGKIKVGLVPTFVFA